jgi:hypothetical protein
MEPEVISLPQSAINSYEQTKLEKLNRQIPLGYQ